MRLYKYGVNILGTSMLTKFTDEGISVIIAKFLSPYSLGIFTRSSQFATFPTSSIGSIINTVLFPSLSSLKGKRDEYSQLYRKSIEVQAAFCIPMYFLIAMSAHSIVVLLLTKKWIDVVPILQILCIGRILAIIAISTEQNLIASGHSNLYLKQQLLKLILKVSLILIALPFGLIAIAVADAMQTLCQFFITNYVASNITKFNTKEQLMKIYPFIFSSIFAALIGFVVTMNIDNIFIQLLLSIVVFIIAFFIIILRIFKTETYKYIVHQLHIRNKLK
jgi:teichuronic acid exporter